MEVHGNQEPGLAAAASSLGVGSGHSGDLLAAMERYPDRWFGHSGGADICERCEVIVEPGAPRWINSRSNEIRCTNCKGKWRHWTSWA